MGNYQEAIKDSTKAIELNPVDVGSYIIRGVAYESIGNYQQAIEDYTKVIELKQDGLFYYKRAIAYVRLGNHQQAIKDFSKAIELKPDMAEAYLGRGIAYLYLGNYQNYQEVLNDFKIAARLGNKDAQDTLLKTSERW